MSDDPHTSVTLTVPAFSPLTEALWASAAILTVLTIVKHAAQAVPEWSGHILVLATAFQLYSPLWLLGHNKVSWTSLGLNPDTWRRVWSSLGTAILLFGIGYTLAIHYAMTEQGATWMGTLPPYGLERAITEFAIIAGPEELYFRGYLQERFTRAFGPRKTWLAIALSSGIFALAHFVGEYNPNRLLTFFPSLVFGTLYAHTGSLIAPVIFHAFCNVLALVLQYAYRVV
ncbi:MAG: CPBP family intramembrane metalloprotease [Myxococcales bacterium]|nr:CPBP family intramembrane metalloprotease [Myxococcales bacterium]